MNMKINRKIFAAICATAFAAGSMPVYAQQPYGQRYDSQSYNYRPDHSRHGRPISEEKFSVLYSKVKKASFDDGKFDLIEVACLGCQFTCKQASHLIGVFSFSSKKLSALEMLAPHIVDKENGADIIKQFNFSSDKDKAADILWHVSR